MIRRLHRERRGVLEQLESRDLLSCSPLAAVSAATAVGAAAGVAAGVAARVAAKVAAKAVGDDFGNTIAAATPIALAADGSGSQSGVIETALDVDMFSIVAPVMGTMTLTQSAATGSRLDSYLYVYDSAGRLLARNDDFGRSVNSRIDLSVAAGTKYYVKAAAFGRSTGAYVLAMSTVAELPDDFGNNMAAAAPIALAADGSGSRSGVIEKALDVDMFSVVATISGKLTVVQSAAKGSSLDSCLYVYDANGSLLARNDDFGAGTDSQVQIDVTAGTKYFVKAAAYSRSTGAYNLQITTVGNTPPPPGPGAFQIDVTMTGFTSAQQQVVQDAVGRWEQIVIGDLPDVANRGAVIDDLQIALSAVRIDGVGGTLGQSSATAFRSGSGLPYQGYIQLDTADVAAMQADGSLQGVLEHEIAHVLGFGVIWRNLGLLIGATTTHPGFNGRQAVAEYNTLFGTNATAVPVEAGGGAGTRLSHWSESVFANELMTGWHNSGQTNPLSRITIASLADMGYTVDLAAADAYTRPAGVRAAGVAAASASKASNAAALYSDQYAADWSLSAADRRHAVDRVMSLESWRG